VVPVVGTIAGAVIGAVAAISYWAGKDKFHPSPLEAQQLLALFRADPGLLFEGIDKAGLKGKHGHSAEELAARLVRYLKVVAGEVPRIGPLYNPISNLSNANPYFGRVDPSDPLTDPRRLHQIKLQVQVHRLAPPMVSTPEQAKAVLAVLRADLVAKGSIVGWSQIKDNLPALRREIAYLRGIAGEKGAEPVLGKILGGDILASSLAF